MKRAGSITRACLFDSQHINMLTFSTVSAVDSKGAAVCRERLPKSDKTYIHKEVS